jgi:hypothetical protein
VRREITIMIDMRGRPYDDEKENLLDIFESSIVKRHKSIY